MAGRDHSMSNAEPAEHELQDGEEPVKRAEALLRESERRYSALFSNKINGMAHCCIITDQHGRPVDYRYLQINEAYERIVGIKKGDIEGRRAREVFPQITTYAFDYIGSYGKVALQGGEVKFEQFFEGTKQYLSIYAYSPLPGEFTAIFSDVTERKRDEEDAWQKKAELKEAQRLSHVGSWHWDAKSDLFSGSDELLRIYGFDPAAQFLPNFREQRGRCYPVEEWERLYAAVQKTVQTGTGYQLDLKALRHDAAIWVTARGEAVRDAAGRVVGLRGTVQDITERKQAEEDILALNSILEQRSTELEAAVREQESFSYSVSHDLRAPLRHINSFSNILLEDYGVELPSGARYYLERISGATRKMSALIDHLLELSRVVRTELKRERVNLSKLAKGVAAMLQETEPERCVKMKIEDGLLVQGDRGLLRQLLVNLLGNAWKYSSVRPVAEIEFGRTGAAGEQSFFVMDNGAGFDMAYSGKLFESFQRLHGAEFEGTGIGLATAQRIVQRHGGTIWAQGKVDEGAVFYFTLS